MENLHSIDVDRLGFVGSSLKLLREEVGSEAAVLGFIGAPWTLATYMIEGGSSSYYKIIKAMMHSNPELLEKLLSFLAIQIAEYAKYQVNWLFAFWYSIFHPLINKSFAPVDLCELSGDHKHMS